MASLCRLMCIDLSLQHYYKWNSNHYTRCEYFFNGERSDQGIVPAYSDVDPGDNRSIWLMWTTSAL
jgi:hypothetical protein